MKLMIADDEKWVRMTVKALIPFDKLGLTLSSEAANGIEALELCRRHEPDILLTDIKMPGLTGLDLIKEVRKLLPSLRIIIISGFNDFEYAKTAMKYGITDYLLKPIDEKELIQVLERMISEITVQARLKKDKEIEQEQYKKALPVMCEAFLNQMISRNIMTADRMRNELHKYGIDLASGSYTLCVTSPDRILQPEEDGRAGDYLRVLIKRAMRKYIRAVSFPLEQDKTTIVSIIGGENNKEGLQKAFHLCNRILIKKFGLSISAGISGTTHQLCMLQELYSNACEALETRFWTGAGTFAAYRPGQLVEDTKLALSEDTLNKITLNLKLSNIQTALSYVDGICKTLQDEGNIKPSAVREFFWQFVQSLIILLNIQLPFIRHESAMTGSQPYERIKGMLFISSLESYIKQLLEKIYDFYHDINPVNNNLVESAKRIIEVNFAGDISLEQVARHVHLSSAYLSELFKKETGMSFIDYKTIIRIEYAKKLLSSPSMNISEISGKVGYSDPKYFSKLFKKITGKTIYEYRKGI